MRKGSRILSGVLAVAMMIAMTACGGTATVEDTVQDPVAEQKQETVADNSTDAQETSTAEDAEVQADTQEADSRDSATSDVTFSGPVEFTIASVGGMYFDDEIISAAKDAGGYDYLFEDAKSYIEGADVAIGVIQTPLKNSFEGYDIASAIKNAGFDVINVATTNVADNGELGLNITIGQPHTNGMEVCGVTSQVNPYNKIAYVDVKGVKVAFIAGAEGAVSEEGRYDINTIDEDLLVSQIEEAKSEGAMMIVVNLNFADNGQDSLEQDKVDFFNRLGSAGANLVLCSGLDRTIISGGAMDAANGIYGKYVSYQGCFVASTTDIAALFRINVRIDESGYVDVLSYTTQGKVIYIDSADHYRLVPISADDAANGDYSDAFKSFAYDFYNQYNEINQ